MKILHAAKILQPVKISHAAKISQHCKISTMLTLPLYLASIALCFVHAASSSAQVLRI